MENNTATPLFKFWEKAVAPNKNAQPASNADWNEQIYNLTQHGRGMGEALSYLYNTQPSFPAFMEWLQITSRQDVTTQPAITGNILSGDDIDFWNKNGYIVIKNAVPAEQCAATRNAIWEHLGADANDPATWYRQHASKKGLMLDFFQHPTLNSNRNAAIIKKCYEELYGGIDIYLFIDKVSYNPPETDVYRFQGSPLHWDVSLHPPIPYILQGLLYLNDVTVEDGAFHCVPGFQNKIEKWMAGLPENTDPRQAALANLNPIAIPGAAGDLVIWHNALPHCATPNKGVTPRMVQYISYKPVKANENETWK